MKKEIIFTVLSAALGLIIGILLSFLFFGCVFPEVDPLPVDAGDCEETQDWLEDLACDELLEIPGADQIIGTEDDPRWADWCEWVQDSGIDTLDLACILTAQSCDAVESCLD